MKIKAIIILIFFFCLTQTGFAEDAKKTAPQPELKIIESTYAFETIAEGEEIIHDFTIKNTGNAPLDVLKVKPG
jgi:hypothetical protein